MAYIPLKAGKHQIKVILDMAVKFVRSKTMVRFDAGKVAVMRGPIVYCAESTDNIKPLWNYIIHYQNVIATEVKFSKELGGIVKIKVPAYRRILDHHSDPLYINIAKQIKYQIKTLNMIPYYAWNNRGCVSMLVWFDSNI